jgi:hypothetical protein
MPKLAFATGQSPIDLAQAVGPAKLEEEHSDERPPARKSFGCVVGAMLFHGLLGLKSGKQ